MENYKLDAAFVKLDAASAKHRKHKKNCMTASVKNVKKLNAASVVRRSHAVVSVQMIAIVT